MLRMDKLDFALEVMVVGFFVVLVTLFLLYGILLVFNRIFNKELSSSDNNLKYLAKAETRPDNSILTAVITAAVYGYLESATPSYHAANFRVTAYPMGGGAANSWQLIGRRQLMEGKAELETTRRNKNREKI